MKNGFKRIIIGCAAMALLCGCSLHRSGVSSNVSVDTTRTEANYMERSYKSAFESFAANVRKENNVTFLWIRRDTSKQPDSSGQYPVAEEARLTDLSVTQLSLSYQNSKVDSVISGFEFKSKTGTFSQTNEKFATDVDNDISSILWKVIIILAIVGILAYLIYKIK